MKLDGGCHCSRIRYELSWPPGTQSLPARRCTCSYCTRFGGCWTSHPKARLDIVCNPVQQDGRYRFATGTADFLFCSQCGVIVVALSDADDSLKAVVNINTLDDYEVLEFEHSDSNFDDESRSERLGRRSDRWISRVNIH